MNLQGKSNSMSKKEKKDNPLKPLQREIQAYEFAICSKNNLISEMKSALSELELRISDLKDKINTEIKERDSCIYDIRREFTTNKDNLISLIVDIQRKMISAQDTQSDKK